MGKKRAAAYARVSTSRRSQEHSYEFQSAYWAETLGNSAEYEYVGIYADKGISGKFPNRRPQFLAMVDACRNGKHGGCPVRPAPVPLKTDPQNEKPPDGCLSVGRFFCLKTEK